MADQMTGTLSQPAGMLIHWMTSLASLIGWEPAIQFPPKFKPTNIDKHDGNREPSQWLQCYSQAIELAGGDNDVNAIYFPMVLDTTPQTWFESNFIYVPFRIEFLVAGVLRVTATRNQFVLAPYDN